jgi:hypothetical protein
MADLEEALATALAAAEVFVDELRPLSIMPMAKSDVTWVFKGGRRDSGSWSSQVVDLMRRAVRIGLVRVGLTPDTVDAEIRERYDRL